MEFSQRQRKALEILLRGGGADLTLAQVATGVGVSARTVHRELARIAPALRANYGIVLAGKAGQGFSVSGDGDRIRACLEELEARRGRETDETGRKRVLAAFLLEGDGIVKLQALEASLGGGEASLRRDLEELGPWFASTGLSISLRRGLGVVLEGPEKNRREALATLFMDEFGESGIIDLINEEGEDESNPVRDLLLGIVAPGLFQTAESVLAGLARGSLPSLAPRDYLGLVALLAVSVERRRRGFRLESEDGAGNEADTASSIALGLAKLVGLESDPAEAALLRRYFRGAKPERPGDVLVGEMDLGSLADLGSFTGSVERRLGVSGFGADPVLRDGLAAHWGPALYRLGTGLPIRNPLLEQIKADYHGIFVAVGEAAAESFPELTVPEDEIAYLVLHFAASLERTSKRSRRFRALVVCSAGIGSANMLASRIHAELPEIEVVASLSWFEADRVARDEWDILVSTIPLPLEPGDYILVSPLLPAAGVEAIRAFIAGRRDSMSGAAPSRLVTARPSSSGLVDLRAMSGHLGSAIAVLEDFRLFVPGNEAARPRDAMPATTWEALLATLIAGPAGEGQLLDPGLALRDLEKRSSDGGLLLPSSSILFLHARSRGVDRALLSIHVLSAAPEPPPTRGGPWERRPRRIILMLAPPGLGADSQDILNEISSSFLDEKNLAVLSSGEESDIRNHYSRLLDRYARSLPGQGAIES